MNTIFLITGGNIGDRKKNLETSASLIESKIGKIIKSSKIYETDAWGITNQNSFYNQVHQVLTKLSAEEVMKIILEIEEKMGRVRTIKNAARVIDIDILFFNDDIVNEEKLTIPHAEIINRQFVLTPLNEIASDLIHPVYKKKIQELLSLCNDTLKATLLT